jgi:hypothetical protein
MKSFSTGDNRTSQVSYSSRLQATDFAVTNLISKHYEYNADASLSYSQDNLDNRFDRSYTYDHLGRMVAASSGPLARGQADNDNRPYKLTYGYDAFNNLIQRVGRVWTTPHEADTGSGVYANGRNTGWQYDVDGRLLGSTFSQYSYDAAGRAVNVFSSEGNSEVSQTQVFDADGLRTKLINQRVIYNANGTITNENKTQYFVTSSVLNSIVTELNESGQKTRTFVYQGGQVFAWQQQNGNTQTIAWEHRDVSHASVKIPGAPAHSSVAELEPMGSDAGAAAPLASAPDEPVRELTYPGFASAGGEEGTVDGMSLPYSIVLRMLDSGAARQCPDNYCGPRVFIDPKTGKPVVAPLITNPDTGQLGYNVPILGRVDVNIPGYPYQRGHESIVGYRWVNSPQNPRPLTGTEIDKLGSNLQTFLADSECGKFISALLGSLPADKWKTTRYSGSMTDAFNRINSNGGFWSGDTISQKALAMTDPNTLRTTFDSQRITPLITGQSWQQFGATVLLIHELTHVFTNAPNYGAYGHLQMAQAASDAASSLGLDVKSALQLDFPTQKKYGTGWDYEVALSDYFNKTLAYACRKVKL